MNKLSKWLPQIFLLVALLLIYHSWLTPQVLCKGDCVFFFKDNLEGFLLPPLFWNTSPSGSGLGFFALPTLAFAPPSISLGLVYKLTGFPFNILEKIVWFYPFLIISAGGIWFLGKQYCFNRIGLFFSTLLYLGNTYILMVLDGGQIGIALGYALIPWIMVYMIKSLRSDAKKSSLILGLLMAILVSLDLRIAYLTYFLILFYALFYLVFENKLSFSGLICLPRVFIFLFVIPLLLNIFWIGPLILVGLTGIPSLYTLVSQISFLSFMDLVNGLFWFQPHWYLNFFGKLNPTDGMFFIFPALAFLAVIFSRKYMVVFWAIISLVSIFLIKGGNEPLSFMYPWLYRHLAGFNLFRDPSKFYILLSLSYSLLIGISLEKIFGLFLKNRLFILGKMTLIATCLLFLFFIKPVWLGKTMGTFRPEKIPQEYLAMKDLIFQETAFFRVAWYPNKREFGYSSPLHPSIDASLDLFHQRPFDIAIGGTYDIFSYLGHPFSPQLFDVLGIKYLTYADSLKKYPLSESEIKDRVRIIATLKDTKWLKKVESRENLLLFETKSNSDHFFVTKNNYGVIGSDSLYWKLNSFPGFRLNNWSLVYFEDGKRKIDETYLNEMDNLIINNKDWMDTVFLLAGQKSFSFPALSVKDQKQPDKSWIVKQSYENIEWRDLLARKAFKNIDFDGGGGFVSADNNPQSLSYDLALDADFDGGVYMRYFSNRLGGVFSLTIDDHDPVTISTKTLRDNFIWEKLINLELNKGTHKIKLENIKGFNACNALVFLPDKEKEILLSKTKEIFKQKNIVYSFEGGEATKSAGINIFTGGTYEILVLTSPNTNSRKLRMNINNQILETAIDQNSPEKWYSLGTINLQSGINHLKPTMVNAEEYLLVPGTGKSFMKEILDNSKNEKVNYKMINPTKYKVTVQNFAKTDLLIFSETYHPLWQITVKGSSFGPLPVYSMINGFKIDKSGDLEIMVEFTPQRLLPVFLAICLISFSILLSFILKSKE